MGLGLVLVGIVVGSPGAEVDDVAEAVGRIEVEVEPEVVVVVEVEAGR